ncbi:MAG: hypothetical protein DRR06_13160, partial [Gammaproteobacteria bacterium]
DDLTLIYPGVTNKETGWQAAKLIGASTNGNFVLGDHRFKEDISKTPGRRVIPGKAGRPVKNES